MEQFAWLIIALPLAGFLLNGIFGSKLPKAVAGTLGSLLVFIPFLIACGIFSQLQGQEAVHVHLGEWFKAGNFSVSFNLVIDHLSVLMLLIITGVGSLIHLYSIGYMHDDERFPHFFAYLNLFIFFMLLLVLGDNYLLLFVGWEGVGLCSYLLIGFWFKNQSYNNAARKAFVINRIGDLGLLMGLFLTWYMFGTLNIQDVAQIASGMPSGNSALFWITLCFFIGATGKSAQIPLYTWLPDAMAGPTPVSALIHAATMVTAGIYLVARSSVIFNLSPLTMDIITYIGIATSIFAATIGLKQNDIKKVLAYSTVSQLGLIFFALGLGGYTAAFFHLMTHAFFKALLFLAAGSVIHGLSGEQDIRKMGNVRKKMPVTFLVFLIGTLAIAGIPPLSGFFSKDEMLLEAYKQHPAWWALGVGSSLLTTFYMFRLLWVTFFGTYRGDHHTWEHAHESPISMTLPLGVLALLSIAGGALNIPHLFGGHAWLHHWLQTAVSFQEEITVSHATEWALMGITTALVLVVIGITWVIYVKKQTVPQADEAEKGLEKLIGRKYYIDELYESVIMKPLNFLATILHGIIDTLVIDSLVNGAGRLVVLAGKGLRLFQQGAIGFYVFAMVLGLILILLFNQVIAI